jgi:hypothetical protein
MGIRVGEAIAGDATPIAWPRAPGHRGRSVERAGRRFKLCFEA